MKKLPLLATAILALALAAQAAPLDPKGIPADAQGIVHLDLDLCAKSAIGDALKKYAAKALLEDAEKQRQYDDFKNETGIDPLTDLNGITLGIFKDENGGAEPAPGVIVARGKFSAEKITACARKNNNTVSKLGSMTLIEGTDMFDALGNGKKTERPKNKNHCIAIASPDTLLIGETAGMVKKAAAAFSGETPSYATPAVLDTFGKQGAAPMVILYANRELTGAAGPQMPISKAENALFSLSETGASLHARIFSEYPTPEAARKTQAAVQMLIGFLQMGAANSERPEAAEQMQSLQRLVDNLRINTNGKSLDITADYPVAELVQLLKKHAGEQ